MKRKSTDRRSWPRVSEGVTKVRRVNRYTLVHLHALSVVTPLTVTGCGETLTVMDTGYDWFTFCEPGARHITTVHCNTQGEPVQFYVDIIDSWGVGPNGFPWYDDLYLDVNGLPGGRTEIIDGDELEQALVGGNVTPGQAKRAWDEAKRVQEEMLARRFEPMCLFLGNLHDYLI